uniref:Integrase catalytic domain-containing protein n=1 Tax=Salix viminalis TaxID=40686 RepID=A0A6N2M8Q2_SALVM
MSSMTEGVLAQIISYTTAQQKGSQSANDYFLMIKRLADELVMAGQTLCCDDIISYVLAGLGHDYDSFVSSIYARHDLVSLEEVYSLLILTESRLNRHNQSLSVPIAEANFIHRQQASNSQQSFNSRNRFNYQGRGRNNNYRGGGNYSHNNTFNSSSLVCQVCGKHGHSARKCYHRFDLTYQNTSPSPNKQAFLATQSLDNDWHADTGATHHMTITRVQISYKLEMVKQFCKDSNVYFEFHGHYFLVKGYSGIVLHRGHVSDGLYHFLPKNNSPQAFSVARISFDLWHRRLGLVASPVVHRVLSSNKLSVDKIKTITVCHDCQLAKSHALPFNNSTYVSKTPLELIFIDVWGPAYVVSTTGARYYVSFLDHYSKFLWLFPMKLKSDVEHIFLRFQSHAIQSDWGGEYRRLHKYFQTTGISHRIACPHTHQQVGSIERRYRQIVEVGLSMLAHSKLPLLYWEDAFNTATFLINHLPTPILNNLSPYEILYNRSPDYTFLRVFGINHHGYKCLDLSTGRVYVSRHVIFDENLFPYKPRHSSELSSNPSSSDAINSTHVSLPSFPLTANNTGMQPLDQQPVITDSISLVSQCAGPNNTSSDDFVGHSTPASMPDAVVNEQPPPSTQPASSSMKNQAVTEGQPSIHPMTTRSRNNIFKHKAPSDDFVRYPLPKALLASIQSTEVEPTSYMAMNTEFDALLRNGTWTLTTPPSNANAVSCRWVYKVKRKADGSIERYKARLVAKGFHQQEGIDFNETFKEVYMTQPQGYIHPQFPDHLCKLHKSIYGLRQAPRAWFSRLTDKLRTIGFVASKADPSLFIWHTHDAIVLILIYVDDIVLMGNSSAAINRVIQSLHCDFAVKDLGELGFFWGVEVLRTNDGVYLTQRKYVAELLQSTQMTAAKPCSSPMSTTCHLSATEGVPFSYPSLYRRVVGSLQYLSFTRPDLSFSVHKAVKRILRYLKHSISTGLFIGRSSSTVIQAFSDSDWAISLPLKEFHFLILLFIEGLLEAVKRILRYLKHSISTGLFIGRSSSTAIQAFSDSDWAGDRDDRRSIGAYCVFMGFNLISWRCKQQLTVARSSTEAEYKALAYSASEIQWIQSLLSEIGSRSTTSPVLWCDNIGATYLTVNPMFHARTKHIEIDFHYIRDQVQRKQLSVQFISSKDQLVDSLTKPVSPRTFTSILINLNVRPLPFRLRGRVEETIDSPANHADQESDQDHSATNARDIRNKIMPYPAITRDKSGRRSDYMQLSQEKNQDQDYLRLR